MPGSPHRRVCLLDAPADAIWLFQIDRPAAETSGDLWPLQPQGLVITDEAYGPLSKPAPALQIPRPEPAGSSKSLALPGTLPGALPGAGPLPAKAPRRGNSGYPPHLEARGERGVRNLCVGAHARAALQLHDLGGRGDL